ncbi:hypothetical protein, partial [Mesorhizobium sp. M0134]|uniref:hypothetical protein n=1 Tax=unclassified Mesorhizobium TaxID=325217 RepID=UPI00333ACD51
PATVRGPTRPADGQNCGLTLSGPRGALQFSAYFTACHNQQKPCRSGALSYSRGGEMVRRLDPGALADLFSIASALALSFVVSTVRQYGFSKRLTMYVVAGLSFIARPANLLCG